IFVQVEDDEITVAILEDNKLVEVYLERSLSQRLVGNVYKGKVENVLPGMQAAFVNIGLGKNAFLYIEDALTSKLSAENRETSNENEQAPSIGDILKEGQDIIVQITKEPFGTKGARVTTHITLPGRYAVLMPTVDYVGISRRITTDVERDRLKGLAHSLKPPGMGLIVRTATEGATAEDLKADIDTLGALWKKIKNRSLHGPVPNMIHRDLELLQRILRDFFTEDIDRMLLNSRYAYQKALEALDTIAPQMKNKVYLKDSQEFLEQYDITSQIQDALKRKVWLKCGGYIVIDHMEALTVIDVNTGKYVGSTNLNDTILKTNLEAAVEIARQLRLRNIGGIIIIDFIDMDSTEHQELVLKALEEQLKKDRTKTNILGITQLGLLEMTRKKARQGLESVMLKECPYCEGRGRVLSEDTVCLKAKKEIFDLARKTDSKGILVEANPAVAACLIGTGGNILRHLEERMEKHLVIKGVENLHLEDVRIRVVDNPEGMAALMAPVQVGQLISARVEETHATNIRDGIARIQGFVLNITDAGAMIGQEVPVQVTKVFRTYAKARLVDGKTDSVLYSG
ncbi:MAG: Rne/Rng family ribonuclease, partial [Bacillota bacterium]